MVSYIPKDIQQQLVMPNVGAKMTTDRTASPCSFIFSSIKEATAKRKRHLRIPDQRAAIEQHRRKRHLRIEPPLQAPCRNPSSQHPPHNSTYALQGMVTIINKLHCSHSLLLVQRHRLTTHVPTMANHLLLLTTRKVLMVVKPIMHIRFLDDSMDMVKMAMTGMVCPNRNLPMDLAPFNRIMIGPKAMVLLVVTQTKIHLALLMGAKAHPHLLRPLLVSRLPHLLNRLQGLNQEVTPVSHPVQLHLMLHREQLKLDMEWLLLSSPVMECSPLCNMVIRSHMVIHKLPLSQVTGVSRSNLSYMVTLMAAVAVLSLLMEELDDEVDDHPTWSPWGQGD